MKSKSEIKRKYKQHKADMGVFQIVNIENGNRLIDYSLDMNSKWNRHVSELNFGVHKNSLFQYDWNELGKDCFSFEIISKLEYQENPSVNYTKELKALYELVLEDINTMNAEFY